jgi:microcystin-dependent protein/N-acetylneuraminic acid mutarotase/lipopolysaccharide export system protein LptA
MIADGQLLSIAQNITLFALLGTTYGGDGVTTFALPDLTGRTIIGASAQNPLGAQVGANATTIQDVNVFDGAPVDNTQPSLALNYIISTQGASPSTGTAIPPGEPVLGEIVAFAGSQVPTGWALADGRLLSISQNQLLFDLLGTTYGGNGTTNFALPDLRDRAVVGIEPSSGGSPVIPLGEQYGSAGIALTAGNLPLVSNAASTLDTVHVGPRIDEPAITQPVSWTIGSPTPVPLAPDAIITDPDSGGLLTGASVQLDNDLIGIGSLGIDGSTNGTTAGGAITYSFNGATLALTGTASIAAYQTALEAVTFSAPSATQPVVLGGTASLSVTDGNLTSGNSNTETIAVVVAAAGTPQIDPGGPPATFVGGGAPVAVAPTLNLLDPGTSNVTSALVLVALFNGVNFDELLINGTQTGTLDNGRISYAPDGLGLSLTGSDSLSAYQDALRLVSLQTPGAVLDEFVDIGWGVVAGSTEGQAISAVIAQHAPPTITAGASVTFTGGGAAVTLDNAVTVSDPDSGGNLAGATVSIGSGYLLGDTLSFANTATITGSYDPNLGVLTLSGTDTIANYATALDSVTYGFNPANGDPTAGTHTSRTIDWVVNDGVGSGSDAMSAPATSTLTVTHAAPTVTAGATAILEVGQASVVLDSALTVSDPDSGGNLTGATVALAPGELVSGDVLSFTNTAAITGSYNSSTGVLTLSGTDTIADYQSALESVAFSTTSTPGTRDIGWSVSDGSTSNGTSRTAISRLKFELGPTVMAGATATFTAGGAAVTLDGTLKIDDPASTMLVSATVTIGGAISGDTLAIGGATSGTFDNAISFAFAGATLTLTGTDSVTAYQSALEAATFGFTPANGDATGGGTDTTRTITWAVDDGLVSATATSTLDVVPAVPKLAGTTNASFTENAVAAVTLSPSVTVSDPASPTLASATVALGGGTFLGDGDVLSATATAAITVSYDSAGERLILSGTDTLADYAQVLDGVTFTTPSDNPTSYGSDPTRTVIWTLDDGRASGTLGTATTTVSIAAINDPPTLAGTSSSVSFRETGGAVTLSGAASVSDPDSLDLASATVAITGGGFSGDGDVLAVSGAGGTIVNGAHTITVAYDTTNERLTLTGSDTLADYQAALRAVTFSTPSLNPADFGSNTSRTVTWTLNDGSASSATAGATETIGITAVDNPPTLSLTTTASFTEKGGPVTLAGDLSLSDPDNLTLASATVAITGAGFTGDVLAVSGKGSTIVNGAHTISLSYDTHSETLTLSGSDTLADYQAALRAVTFDSTSLNPTNFGARTSLTATWTVNDGSLSRKIDSTIHVTAVDDPPTLAGVATSVTLNAQSTVTLSTSLTVSDPDNIGLAGATVAVTGGTFAGDGDVLSADTTGTAITASYNSTTETLTLTGTGTFAAYQKVLDTVTFQSNILIPAFFGADPHRTITWTVSDGVAISAPEFESVSVLTAPALRVEPSAVFAEGAGRATLSPVMLLSDTDPPPLAWTRQGASALVSFDDAVDLSGGKIYELGAIGAPAGQVAVYDPVTDAWSTISVAGLGSVSDPGSAVDVLGRIYLINGSTSTVRYDPSTGSVTSLAAMPGAFSVGVAAATGVDGRIYAFGGSSPGNTFTTNAQVYNPSTDTWSSVAASPLPVVDGSAVVDGTLIYLVPGESFSLTGLRETETVQVYDTVNNTWSQIAEPTEVLDPVAGLVDGKLVIAGGSSGANQTTLTQIYDPATGTWTSGPALPTATTSSGRGLISDGSQLFVVGGFGSNEQIVQHLGHMSMLSSATVAITGGTFAGDGDVLSIDGQTGGVINIGGSHTIALSYDSATETLTLTGSDTLADYQQLLERVTFESTSPDPTDFGSAPARTVTWTVSDGIAASVPQTETVTVEAGLSLAVSASATFTEGGGRMALSPAATLSDFNPGPLAWTTQGASALVSFDDAVDLSGGKIYEFGAIGAPDGQVDVYDPATDAWSTISIAGLGSVTDPGSAVDALGRIYLINGSTSTVRYDPSTGTVTALAAMPGAFSVGVAAATGADGRIYAFGGSSPGNTFTTNAQVYDPGTDTWSSIAASPLPVVDGSAVVDGTLIYLVPGISFALTEVREIVQVYDTVNNTWSQIAEPTEVQDPVAGIVDGKLVIAGGISGANQTTLTQIYDPANGTWTSGPALPTATSASGRGLISDGSQLFVVGGHGSNEQIVQHLGHDAPMVTGATVAITGGTFAGDGDVLSINGQTSALINIGASTITLSYHSATETLTLTGTDTAADYQQVLESVNFQSTSANPTDFGSAPTRTVTWTVNDNGTGAFGTDTATSTISVLAINNPPTLSALAASVSFTEKAGPVTLSGAAKVLDPDSLTLASATVAIGAGATPGDVLAASTSGTSITASYDSSAATLVLTGVDSLAHYQQVLDSVTFDSTSANPTEFGATPRRTVTWTLNDGSSSNATGTATTTIGITAVDDPPTLGSVAPSVNFIEGLTIGLAPFATVTDPDNQNLASATVRIVGGTFAGDGDVLAAVSGSSSITTSYDSTTETLTLTGSDLLSDYAFALRTVVFSSGSNPDDYGSNPTRAVTWTLNDGNATATTTTTINVTAVNNPPTLTGVPARLGFTEMTGPLTLASAAAVSDPDSLTLASATVAITGGTFAGDGDLLAANTSGTAITASYDSASETLVLSGADTLADYSRVLDSVTFATPNPNARNFGVDPTRTVTWTLDDGSASNATAVVTSTIDIADAPPTLTGVAASATLAPRATLTLSPGVTVSDPDNLVLAGATVAITGGTFAGDGDVLAANTAGTAITASYNSSTETLTLTGADTPAAYQQVLDTVTLTSTSPDPTAGGNDSARVVTWTLNDGSTTGTPQSETVSVVGTPSLTVAASATFVAGVDPVRLSPAVTLRDPNPGALVWTTEGSFASVPTAGAADLVGGKLYAIDGSVNGTGVSAILVYDPVAKSWSTDSKTDLIAREFLASAVDAQGRIYLIGGLRAQGLTSEVTRFDPASNTVAPVASLPFVLESAAAATGADGRIYVFGGSSSAFAQPIAEVYDPNLDSWSAIAPLPLGVEGAVAVADGTLIYVIGGAAPSSLARNAVQVYDTVHNTWSQAATLPVAVSDAIGGLVGGKIVVAGGAREPNPISVTTTQIYDPITNTWTSGPDLPVAVQTADQGLVSDGSQLFVAGGAGGFTTSVTSVQHLIDVQELTSATVTITGGTFAGDGDVLAANTTGTSIAASYNAATETLTLTGADTLADYSQVLESITFNSISLNPTDFGSDPTRTVTWTVNDGTTTSTPQTETVTIEAGPTLGVTASASFTESAAPVTLSPAVTLRDPNPGALAWTAEGSFASVPTAGAADLVGGKLYAVDGNVNGTVMSAILVYDPVAKSWSTDSKADLIAREFVASAVDAQGRIYVIGGLGTQGLISEVTRFDPASNTVAQVASLPFVLESAAAATGADGRIYVFGGSSSAFAQPIAEVYDPNLDSWSAIAPLPLGVEGAVAVADGTLIYVIGGAAPSSLARNAVQVYDTVHNTWSQAATLPVAVSDAIGGIVDGKIVVAGGAREPNPISVMTTQIYDPITDTWTSGPDLPVAVQTADQGLVSDGSQLFVAGGAGGFTTSVTSVQHLIDVQELTSATVTITGGTFAGDGDVLAANTTGTSIAASYNSSTETLTLTGADTLADYQQVLESITFQSTSLNPTDFGADPTRTVTWTVNDGTTAGFGTTTATSTINITAIDNPPTLAGFATASFTEKAGPVALASGATVADPDNLTLASATVAIVAGGFAGDVLAANTSGTAITASYNSATETLVLTGTDTFADYQSVIDSVTFNSPSLNPTDYGVDPTRLVVWTVNEGGGASLASVTTTINVTAVNDPPTLSNVAAAAAFHIGHTITVSPHLTVSDPDNLTLASATVQVTGGFAGDGDLLAVGTSGTSITASYNAATETLTLSGSDTLAHYQQVLDSLTFSSGINPTNSDINLNPTRTLTWTANDGAGSNSLGTATTTISIAPTIRNDFNGDQVSDLLFQDIATSGGGRGRGGDPAAGTPEMIMVSGMTAASIATLANPGTAWRIAATGDFNADGDADIVWQSTDGTPMLWTMNGTTVTSSTTLANPGSSWRLAATGDFNNDGNADLLFQNTDGTPMIWSMNGKSVATSALLSDPGSSWKVIGTGDFNGDGKSDIVFQNTDGTPQIWLMNGPTVTGAALLPDPGASWRLVGTGDFNGDGKSDLLFQNSDGTPQIWTMNGTSVASSAMLSNPGSSWKAIGTDDFNGDGKADILFQSTDGTPMVWAMNATTVTATATLPSPGANWHASTG